MDFEVLQNIKDQLFNKKTKDYSNLTFFFLIFSVFVFFVIRPSLTTAFSLQSKEATLKETEVRYEEIVSKIPAIQSALEQLRSDQHLITESLPATANINSLLQDIQTSGIKSGMNISKMSVNNVDLVGPPRPALKKLTVEIEASSTYDKVISFQRTLHNQKRLKEIKTFQLSKSEGQLATGSGLLNVKMQIDGYFL